MFRRSIFLAFLLGVISLAGAQEKPRFAGPTADGFLLPNGWTISPAGEQVALTDLPLNIIPLADNKHALVACSGYNPHALSLVNLQTKQIVSEYSPGNSWFGLALAPEANKVWWSGANDNLLHTLELKDNTLRLIDQIDAAAGVIRGCIEPGMEVTASPAESTVRFQSGKREEDLAGVLKALIDANVAITQFREVQTDLEDAFMTVAKQAEETAVAGVGS